MANVHTTSALTDDLRRLGLCEGDVVMVHVSLRAVGPTEDGVHGLLRALEDAVGVDGGLLVPVGALVEEAVPFDALRTPSDPEIGAFAEVFRRQPGTKVSNHPEGRLAARGHAAEVLLDGQPWNDYHGPGSPLEHLAKHGGKVLRLGADLNTVTLLHYAEYLADLPSKRRARRHRLVRTGTGTEVRVVDCLDDNLGIVDYPDEDYFAAILKAYLATGRAHTGTVGGATSEIIGAGDIVPFAVSWMNVHLAGGSTGGC